MARVTAWGGIKEGPSSQPCRKLYNFEFQELQGRIRDQRVILGVASSRHVGRSSIRNLVPWPLQTVFSELFLISCCRRGRIDTRRGIDSKRPMLRSALCVFNTRNMCDVLQLTACRAHMSIPFIADRKEQLVGSLVGVLHQQVIQVLLHCQKLFNY